MAARTAEVWDSRNVMLGHISMDQEPQLGQEAGLEYKPQDPAPPRDPTLQLDLSSQKFHKLVLKILQDKDQLFKHTGKIWQTK